MKKPIVDVAINVLGKPAQTALALLSLLKYSGRWIDRIYFIEERNQINDAYAHADTLRLLGDRIVHYRPALMNWRYAVDASRLGEAGYRHALRYQYAFEHTDKNYLLLIHNDCEFLGDAVGLLLGNLSGHIGVGEVGQCWLCPAQKLGHCGPGRYREYKPDFDELCAIYDALPPEVYHRLYTQEPTEELIRNPWPLPECRINEYCCLLNMELARPVTCPQGPARPFGAYVDVGNAYTGNGILDIGVAWFGDVVRRGFTAGHMSLKDVVRHGHGGHKDLFKPERYVDQEEKALAILQTRFGGASASTSKEG